MKVSIDWDLPRIYRFLKYRRLRRKLESVLKALKIANLLPNGIEIYRSAGGKGFHVILTYERDVDTRLIRCLANDDPVRMAWDLIRARHGVRTSRLRTAKRRNGRRGFETYDKKATNIAREILAEFKKRFFTLYALCISR